MTLRINHNISAINALRNLNTTDGEMSSSLEKLSSGQKVNKASDGPATLVISEQMRGQVASINQAIQNSESSISMIQTAEAALTEVNQLLISMRQLSIHAANEGANDDKMLAADQGEIENALATIDRIARTSQFGTRVLLDGSNGANGVAVGDGMAFLAAAANTKPSPAEGYRVNITRASTKAHKSAERTVTIADMTQGFQLIISEGGRNATWSLDNLSDGKVIKDMLDNLRRNPLEFNSEHVMADVRKIIAQNLQEKVRDSGLNVTVAVDEATQKLNVTHNEYGSNPIFSVSSSVAGVLGREANVIEQADRGYDVEGTVDGKIGVGEGTVLTAPANTDAQGLVVRFNPVAPYQLKLPKMDPMNNDLEKMAPPVVGARAVSKTEDKDSYI
ncbi:MAG: flagellin, partial [Deltaproteobacteria bacterium]|nr:flagellin [Deltaproteobacteria bacterium]